MTVTIAALLLFATLMATGTQRAEAHTPEVLLIDCLGWSVDLWDYNESTDNSVEIWVDGAEVVSIADFGVEYHTAAAWSPLDPHTLRVKVVAGDGPENPDWSFDRTLTSTACPSPAIDIEKATNGEDADAATGPEIEVGGAVTWTYVVTNTGDADLINVAVTDDQIGAVCTIGDLAVGATETCTATGTAIEGQYANEGTVTGTDPRAKVDVTDTDPSHYIGVLPPPDPEPGIDIEKATNGADADSATGPEVEVDSTVTWTYVVTNTGNVDLTNVVVTDDKLGPVCSFDLLAAGASDECEKTGTAVLGQYENLGTVVGSYLETTVTDTDPSHYIGVAVGAPAIRIVKSADPLQIPVDTATTVTWKIRVSNIGNVPLHDVMITDTLVPACDVSVGDLARDAYRDYECDSTHTPDDLAWTFTNTAVATGYGPDETEVTDSDPATIRPETAVGGTAQLGDTVWWDANENGIQDNGEKGINGAQVTLKDSTGTVIETATTKTGPWVGWYKFVGLEAGRYTATIVMSSVDGDLTTAGSFTVDLEEGQEFLDADFGLYEAEEEAEEEELPNTGLDTTQLAITGLLLLSLGLAAIFATRKRFDS